MPKPVARTMKPAVTGINSSHLIVGVTPSASANATTAMKFIPRLKAAVSDTDRGTTMRGKRTLRSRPSRWTSAATQLPVASPK